MWASFPDKEILLLGEDVTGAFLHPKIHPGISEAHAYFAGQILYIPIDYALGDNASPHNWEVIFQFRYKLAEHFKFSSDLERILTSHNH